jgi:hypothetical protein
VANFFDACVPREDVLKGTIKESDFAADLAQVLRGDAPSEYLDPERFFANTYPTRGLKALLRNVCARLASQPEQIGAIFRLDTQFGGGKTHALIALTHAVKHGRAVKNIAEFIDPNLLPSDVRIAAFDGENADPANGRRMSDAVRAYTPWGELAFGLRGETGYWLVEKSDTSGVAPGAETLRELIGDAPCLILLDELAVYLRKMSGQAAGHAAAQLTAFLQVLFNAVEGTTKAALVYTLALGKEGPAVDAYAQETQQISGFIAEAESISARKATLLDPTEEDETVRVLQRRLFASIDIDCAQEIVAAYTGLWAKHKDILPSVGVNDRRGDEFIAGFPLHPELMSTLTNKTATLGTFQRVRGMLRLLARTVADVWSTRPADSYAIHTHHINVGNEAIRQELVTRLNQQQLVPAIKAEVAAHAGETPALAQQIDAAAYHGLPPYASYVARTTLMHTLAYNDALRGLNAEELRYSIVSPGTDPSFIDDARKRFVADSAYLDDRPNVPLRFLAVANLTQIIRRQEQNTDPGEVRVQLNDRIRQLFTGPALTLVPFAAAPHDVPDDAGDGKPYLVLLNFDAAEISADRLAIPEIIERIYLHKGAANDWRHNRNNLVFLVADEALIEAMRRNMVRHLALDALKVQDKMRDLADYQIKKLHELAERSIHELAVSIQQAYRHVFYPTRNRVEGATCDLGHTAIDNQTASNRPGDGQRQVVAQLQNIAKLRLPSDAPDSPTYIKDRTPLKKGQITTAALRAEFRGDPALSMLVGDEVFLRGIRLGIDQGEYVYRSGDLVMGKGDPQAQIKIDEQSFVLTAAYAREHGIWPRAATPPPHLPSELPAVPMPTPTTPPTVRSPFQASDVLKAALASVIEDAAHRNVAAIAALHIRPFDAGDALKLMGIIGSVPNATKSVTLAVDYETPQGSSATVEFNGALDDALPIKDFVEPQLRAASDRSVTATYTLTFTPPLSLAGDGATKLIERLTRLTSTTAEVTLIAHES